MFDPAAFAFLTDLAANNSRDWFTTHKADHIRLLKTPFAHVLWERQDACATLPCTCPGSRI
ncbi:MAG: DUF2461 family protein [Rhodobacterales bacterium]|nr:DUF2461 family protein [Rhodobacterales bacterium]